MVARSHDSAALGFWLVAVDYLCYKHFDSTWIYYVTVSRNMGLAFDVQPEDSSGGSLSILDWLHLPPKGVGWPLCFWEQILIANWWKKWIALRLIDSNNCDW